MQISAYIIDQIRKEEREREESFYEELQIEIAVPNESTKTKRDDQVSRRGVEEVDFFM